MSFDFKDFSFRYSLFYLYKVSSLMVDEACTALFPLSFVCKVLKKLGYIKNLQLNFSYCKNCYF